MHYRYIYDFSQKSSVPCHPINFDHSVSCVLLIEKTDKSYQILKEISYQPRKKLLKRKGNSITPAKTNALILQTSSEHLKLTIQTPKTNNSNSSNKKQRT